MDEDEKRLLTEKVRETIKASVHPCYENTSKTELYCRCPYCGDSTKSKTSAHFYIRMEPPFLYNCFKCGKSGRMTRKTLEDLGVYDNDIAIGMASMASSEADESKNAAKASLSQRKKIVLAEAETETTKAGLAYLNGRFGSSIDLETANSKFRCSCDPAKFLKSIGVVAPNGFDCSKSIGFVSSDESHLICRDITGKQERRYTNVNIAKDGNDDSVSKIYNIASSIDVMSPEINLVITEGIFDVIGIYLAEYQGTGKEENTIFSAGCGKSYSSVVERFIRKGFLNMNVFIYSDADVDVGYFKEMLRHDPYMGQMKVRLFYNSESKDVGVPKDQIKLVEASI